MQIEERGETPSSMTPAMEYLPQFYEPSRGGAPRIDGWVLKDEEGEDGAFVGLESVMRTCMLLVLTVLLLQAG